MLSKFTRCFATPGISATKSLPKNICQFNHWKRNYILSFLIYYLQFKRINRKPSGLRLSTNICKTGNEISFCSIHIQIGFPIENIWKFLEAYIFLFMVVKCSPNKYLNI